MLQKIVSIINDFSAHSPFRVSQFKNINYVINSTFRKIFDTKLQEVVADCLEMFNYLPAEKTIAVRMCKFLTKFKTIE